MAPDDLTVAAGGEGGWSVVHPERVLSGLD
jgi:hypothetical protein